MGLLDVISDAIRNRQVAKTNSSRRGITEYQPSQIGGFVEQNIYNTNVICSGDSSDLRSEALVSLCVAATNANIPVIVLHQGDVDLINEFRKVYQSHSSYIEVGPNSYRFDPLYQLSNNQISKMIVDTAPQKYALTCDGEAYVDVLTGFLTGKGRMITLKGLYECPHSRMPLLLNSAASKQTLPATLVQDLQSNLAQGQKEAHKVKAYLNELYDECIPLLPSNKADYRNCISIFQAVKQKAIMNINIVSESNTLLLKIIAEQLLMLTRRCVPFFLIVDNISVRDDNAIKSLSTIKTQGFGCAIAGDDVFSLCEGNEKLFSALLGNSQKWFVFHHSSGISAEKWSNAFSKYQKIDTTYNYGRGYGKGSGYGFFGGLTHGNVNWNRNKTNQQGYSYANKDEAVIRAEEIQRLPNRSGFIYSGMTREIAHVANFLPQ